MRSKSNDTKQAIKSFVEIFIMEYGRSPSIRDIAKGVGNSTGTVYRYLLEMHENGLLTYDGDTISTERTRKINTEVTHAPVLGTIVCGIPTLAEENIEEYVTLPVSVVGPGKFFLLHAIGDSMIGAGINSGDLVIVRQQQKAEDGDIVVALLETETTLKRFFWDRENNEIILHPENKEMADIRTEHCVIQGVAVKVIKDLVGKEEEDLWY